MYAKGCVDEDDAGVIGDGVQEPSSEDEELGDCAVETRRLDHRSAGAAAAPTSTTLPLKSVAQ